MRLLSGIVHAIDVLRQSGRRKSVVSEFVVVRSNSLPIWSALFRFPPSGPRNLSGAV
jgi:hypothetical protein